MNKPIPMPAADIERRLALCRACDERGVIPLLHKEICKACGCPLISKTQSPKLKCPKGKWSST